MSTLFKVSRRDFLRTGAVAGTGLVIGFYLPSDASAALAYYGALLGAGAAEGSGYAWQMHMGREQWITLGVGLLWACSPVRLAGGPNWAQLLMMGVAFVMCAAALAAGTFNPFIYFHF